MKILIVDDEKLIRDVIREYLTLEKYTVVEAENGYEAIDKVSNDNFDLIIMDIMMPKLDGFEACRGIKNINKNIPFLFLSAKSEEKDKLNSFDLGVDDYVTKPFSPRELVARINAILKRTKGAEKKYIYLNLVLDDVAHIVTIDNSIIDLTPKEYELLKYLMRNKNMAVSRENLVLDIWGYEYFSEDRTLDTHIKSLRQKLGVYRDNIITLRKLGYKFSYEEEN